MTRLLLVSSCNHWIHYSCKYGHNKKSIWRPTLVYDENKTCHRHQRAVLPGLRIYPYSIYIYILPPAWQHWTRLGDCANHQNLDKECIPQLSAKTRIKWVDTFLQFHPLISIGRFFTSNEPGVHLAEIVAHTAVVH